MNPLNWLNRWAGVPTAPEFVPPPEIILPAFGSVEKCSACLSRGFKVKYRRSFTYYSGFACIVPMQYGPEHLTLTCQHCGWSVDTATAQKTR